MTYRMTQRQREELNTLCSYHILTCPTLKWNERLAPPFQLGGMGPQEEKWNRLIRMYQPGNWASWSKWGLFKVKRWSRKQKAGKKMDQRLYEEWEEQLPLVKRVLEGDSEAWRDVVREKAMFHQQPLAKGYALHAYSPLVAECDVFLHALEDVIPRTIEKATKKGYTRHHPMPKTKRILLYQEHVYSVLEKVANDLFAVLPCQTIYINGIEGDPLFSAVLKRGKGRVRVKAGRYEEQFKKRTGFGPVPYVYCPDQLEER